MPAARLSRIVSIVQILLGAIALAVYFLIRTKYPEVPGYQGWYSVLAWSALAFTGLSIVNFFLLAWEGLIAFKTKEFDMWLWILGLIVALFWLSFLVVSHLFPPFQGV